ncbi:Protein kinase-like domain [Pseudocohnilembus persalinus]|uniref:Protein kinase-like domain n=1 Tax=Pseudocohnilembus persalinus TaxID=266149 RepID=A0A0V0QP12_PSEPJ|nr:Protein kinase-like domain [Pseudocohnilembus persalinus]|eukprot:KRX04079.1 Protein kinase-like domain [Pseudocohnilembus persalinus]
MEKIQQGAQSKVKLAKLINKQHENVKKNNIQKEKNQKYYVVIKKQDFEYLELLRDTLENEIKIQQLNHKNIIKYQKIYYINNEQEYSLYFVMDYVPLTLKKLIKNFWEYQQELVEIQNIEKKKRKKIVHRDIKPENILVFQRKRKSRKKIIKLIDFGLSKHIQNRNQTKSVQGTTIFQPKELEDLEEKKKIDYYKQDVYALGMTFLILCSNRELKYSEIRKVQKKQKYDLREFIKQNCNQCYHKIGDLIERMLEQDVYKRPFIGEVKKQFQAINIFDLYQKRDNIQIFYEQFKIYFSGLQGFHCMKYLDGSLYEGQFYKFMKQGYGLLYNPDGSQVEGQFYKDKINGRAKKIYPDCSIYLGEWVDDKREGKGKLIYFDKIIVGNFQNDKLIEVGFTHHEFISTTKILYNKYSNGKVVLKFSEYDLYNYEKKQQNGQKLNNQYDFNEVIQQFVEMDKQQEDIDCFKVDIFAIEKLRQVDCLVMSLLIKTV